MVCAARSSLLFSCFVVIPALVHRMHAIVFASCLTVFVNATVFVVLILVYYL
jgi:hypothetical protein